MVTIQEYENPEVLETENVISKLRELQFHLKELALQEKVYKAELSERVYKNGGEFTGEKYIATLTSPQKLDEKKIVDFCVKNKVDVRMFSKNSFDSKKIKEYCKKGDIAYSVMTSESDSQRLSIKVKK